MNVTDEQKYFSTFALDMYDSNCYLLAAHGESNPDAKRGLILASVVAYMRPFTSMDGIDRDTRTAAVDLIKDGLTSDDLELHEDLRKFRNSYLAHSDQTTHVQSPYKVLRVKPATYTVQSGYVCKQLVDSLGESDLKKFNALQLKVESVSRALAGTDPSSPAPISFSAE